jgi:hypothetical protein
MKKLFVCACLPLLAFACNIVGGSSPKDALAKFLDAMEKADFTEAKKYATADSQDFLDMISNSKDGADNIYKDKDLVVTDVEKIEGSEADVQAKDRSGIRLTYHLRKEGGVWKVQYNLDTVKSLFINMAKDIIKKAGSDVEKEVNKAIDSIKINLDSLH